MYSYELKILNKTENLLDIRRESNSFYSNSCSAFIVQNSFYVAYTGCVLEHIITTTELSHHEKLYYLLADSLSYINCKNTTQCSNRAASLASEDWASRLGCSRSLVFSMQQSLLKKGYFIIKKTWDKLGRNKRNLIIPTLPAEIFDNLNKESPSRVGEHIPYNPLTESKRSYLDRSKLYIKLNYQLLLTIASNLSLNPLQKILWLGFYTRCYKNYMLQDRESSKVGKLNSNNADAVFSFISSYQELADLYSYGTKCLSKSIKALEEQGFIKTNHFYIRKKPDGNNVVLESVYREGKKDFIQERQDKSLWEITLSLPTHCLLELEKTKDRSSFRPDETTPIPIYNATNSNSSEDYLVVGGVKFNLNSHQGLLLRSMISNSLEAFEHKGKSSDDIKSDPTFSKSTLQLNKDLKTNIKDLRNLDSDFNFSENVDKAGSNLSEFYKNSLERDKNWKQGRGLLAPQLDKQAMAVSKKTLQDYYPLSKEQVDKLNYLSGREFGSNFTNQLLLKLHKAGPDKQFLSSNHMISYMSKAMRAEKHQGPLVNHESFRFACNLSKTEIENGKIEEYLREIECSSATDYQSQLRRKIAGQFDPKLAYRLLTEGKFSFRGIEKEEGELQKEEKRDEEAYAIQLPSGLSLTERQQETIENAVYSVYGNCQIIYEKTDSSRFSKMVKEEGNWVDEKGRAGAFKTVGSVGMAKVTKAQLLSQSQGLSKELDVEQLGPNSGWYKVSKALRKELGEDVYRNWFSQVVAEEHLVKKSNFQDEKSLVLRLPSKMMKDMVRERYGNMIEQYCKDLTLLKFNSYENIVTRDGTLQISGSA